MILECTFGPTLNQSDAIPNVELVIWLPRIGATGVSTTIPVPPPTILLEVTETPSDGYPMPIPVEAFTTVLANMEPVPRPTFQIPRRLGLTIRLLVTVTAAPRSLEMPVQPFPFEVVTSLPFITAVSSGV